VSAPPKRGRPKARVDAAAASALFDLLVEQLAEAVATRLLDANGELYYDVRSIPREIGAKQFRDAAQRKEFPSFQIGNRIVARRADVQAWVASHAFETKAKKSKGTVGKRGKGEDAIDAALRKSKLVPADELVDEPVGKGS